eukprot:gene27199-33888_t
MLGFLEVLNSGGSDAREIASKFGLNLDFANQDNEFISMDDFAKMLEYAARAKNLPCLGLNMSPYHDISILGPLSLVISNLPTVRQAVEYAAKHIDVMSPAIAIDSFPEPSMTQRSSSALRYLTETEIPMTHLSSMVGFSEQATLVRFCKRHFGRSPLALRKNTI